MSPLDAVRRLLRSPSEEQLRAIRLKERALTRPERLTIKVMLPGHEDPSLSSPASSDLLAYQPLSPEAGDFVSTEEISEASLRKLEAASAFPMHSRVLKDVRKKFNELMSRTQKLSQNITRLALFVEMESTQWGHFQRIFAALADVKEHFEAYDLYLCRICSGIDPADLEKVADPFDLELVTHRMLRYMLCIEEDMLLLDVYPRSKDVIVKRIDKTLEEMGECTSVYWDQ
ncbi:hypothetical protein F5Y16DRAFT_398762 [Xylariaceae sp. FL0255]|nr:hypothetical protein F5Y16DRAFT_398762 [Xylariaceae sp. FL0255]